MVLDHIGIVVRNLAQGIEWYDSVFGLRATEQYDLPAEGVRIAFLPSGPVDLELLEPLADSGAVARFLAARGPGLHHIAFRVSDIRAAITAALAAGCTPVDPAPRRGARGHLIAFLHPSTTGGVLVELVEHPG